MKQVQAAGPRKAHLRLQKEYSRQRDVQTRERPQRAGCVKGVSAISLKGGREEARAEWNEEL